MSGSSHGAKGECLLTQHGPGSSRLAWRSSPRVTNKKKALNLENGCVTWPLKIHFDFVWRTKLKT